MKFMLLDSSQGAGAFDVVESGVDKVALIILCVVIPIITIFAIVKIVKIMKKQKEDNKE